MDWAAIYEDDIEGWAEAQVAALRRFAATPGPWSNIIDFENVIEEVEDLGSEKRHAVESLLQNALAHALKVLAEPQSLSGEQWRKEVGNYLSQAKTEYKTSMRRSVDVDQLWRRAMKSAENALRDDLTLRPLRLSHQCPFSIDELTSEGLSVDRALELILAASGKSD